MDRRELMKRHYAEVLMGLCETRDLMDISVTDLVEAAGTARQTFYNYFTDINDLICFAAFQPMVVSADPFTDPTATRRAFAENTRHKEFFRQLSRQTGQNNFWDALDEWLLKTYLDRYLTPDLSKDEHDYRKACLYLYCLGSAALLKRWCASGMEIPSDTIADIHYDMSPDFVKKDLARLPSRMDDYPR